MRRLPTGHRISPIGYRGYIDEPTIIETARRASGLTQKELARRSRTSQSTMSAYERGLKSPSLMVTERILAAAGFELSLTNVVDFEEREVAGLQPFWVPSRLWRVSTPDCFAAVEVPDLTRGTNQSTWDMRDRGDRRRVYEILIRRGLPQFMIRWLDGGFLVDLWYELDLPGPIRRAWMPAIREGRVGPSVDVWSAFSAGSGESPEVARGARIRGFKQL